MKSHRDINALLAVMASLRSPEGGCPWDLRQTFETVVPYTIEEAYEVADAIARADLDDLCEELGDLLFQVVFHARIAQEQGAFEFADVVQAITEKLVRRHPHVFADHGALSEEQVSHLWERIKAEEKAARAHEKPASSGARDGALAGVPAGLPALTRAVKLQDRAADVGFDWGAAGPVVAKIHEEAEEVAAAMTSEHVREEIGDLLFAVVNLARQYGVDPEAALRTANGKFERRFAAVEQALAASGKTPAQATLSEMDALWNACKLQEKPRSG